MIISIQTRLPWQPHTTKCPRADGTGTGSRLPTAFHCYPQYSDFSNKGTFTLNSIVLLASIRSILTVMGFCTVVYYQVTQLLIGRSTCREPGRQPISDPQRFTLCHQRGSLVDHRSGLVNATVYFEIYPAYLDVLICKYLQR